jgi:hypothetical protein
VSEYVLFIAIESTLVSAAYNGTNFLVWRTIDFVASSAHAYFAELLVNDPVHNAVRVQELRRRS